MKVKVVVILTLISLVVSLPQQTQRPSYPIDFPKPPRHDAPGDRITGGQEVDPPHSIPYQVFMTFLAGFGAWYCGGTLISPNYVLTAGHCGKDAVTARCMLGAHNKNDVEPTQEIRVCHEILVHEKFDMSKPGNDIALVRLPEPITYNSYIQPVRLPRRADQPKQYIGQTARISGWGVTDGHSTDLVHVLRYVDVGIISNQLCEEELNSYVDLTNICTSGKNHGGSCNGDSGGPLAINGTQIGIVSFGEEYCSDGYPSVYTIVYQYLDWIQENSDVTIE